jgi:hypothetical protein
MLKTAELQSLGGLQFLASPQQLNINNCPKIEEIVVEMYLENFH